MAMLALVISTLAPSCGGDGAPRIDIGKAECSYCRMNVMDEQFASAIVTKGGRVYPFDSPECMVQHVAEGSIAESEVKGWWVCDHAHPGTLINATTAHYLASSTLHSPMNGNVAAFASEADRDAAISTHPGDKLDWSGARTRLLSH